MARTVSGVMRGAEPALQVAGGGFLFWAVFLLALDPDLIFGAADGWLAAVEQDAPRIVAASMLGSGMAAVQYLLVVRFPVVGEQRLTRLAIHVSACLGLSLAALIIANAGAPLVMPPDNPRLHQSLGHYIASNWLLLTFVLGAFAALLHLVLRPEARTRAERSRAAPAYDARIAVQSRNGTLFIEAARIDWIEAQGNYAALHVGEETHLVRETLTRLAGRLDPACFVRVHRSAIVNVARVRRFKPLSSGDALVELADGAELRASRTFAGALRERVNA
jgi:two-component system, LytTR family, response regulator